MDRLVEKIKNWFHNRTLKQALVIYSSIGVVTVFLCSIAVIIFFENWKEMVLKTNGSGGKEDYLGLLLTNLFNRNQVILYQSGISYTLPYSVQKQFLFLNLAEVGMIMLGIGITIYFIAHLFYKKKLEEPLAIFKTEMQYLSRNDLSFECRYFSGDEMGEICETLNKMRLKQVENQKNIWELIEAQRELNAAFAHDIRTPLTVIKGYIQMIMEHYPKGRISEKRLMEILTLIMEQEQRIEQFSATMKEIHTMEEWKMETKDITIKKVHENLSKNLTAMSTEQVKIVVMPVEKETDIVKVDEHLIQQVADNLVSNALRFAQKEIRITLQLEEDFLYLYVQDDGEGFTKQAMEKAKKPYYSSEPDHFGLGLTICQTLCKKHGGRLELTNSVDGGAIASGMFLQM